MPSLADDEDGILLAIRSRAASDQIRVTQHAHQEMTADHFLLDDIIYASLTAELIENYPLHRRGACCLLAGVTLTGRNIHIVCTTAQPVLIIITVYEPKLPKWKSPTQRSN